MQTVHGLAVAVAASILISGSANAGSQDETPPAPPAAATGVTLPVRALGHEEAPVRVDLYSAFNCVDCAEWYLTVLPSLRSRHIDTGEARLVFHDVAVQPIEYSVKAAMIGLCADPAHFFDVAQAFMSGQAGPTADLSNIPQWYADAIAVAGRDPAEVEECAASEAAYNMVVAQNADPAAAAFSGFPGILVDGRMLNETTLEAVTTAIQASQAGR